MGFAAGPQSSGVRSNAPGRPRLEANTIVPWAWRRLLSASRRLLLATVQDFKSELLEQSPPDQTGTVGGLAGLVCGRLDCPFSRNGHAV